MKKMSVSFLVFSLFTQIACASTGLFHGSTLKEVTLSESLQGVRPGTVVVIGENHGFKTHQNQQVAIMQQLRQQGLTVSVGMEFFYYPDQAHVDMWRDGMTSESDFLKLINWGSPDFSYYRDQAQFPLKEEGGYTLALNAPRMITSAVAKKGIENLDPALKGLLPPDFKVGRDTYRQRFLKLMPHLPDAAAGERYFQAQSVWDDTMAWRAVEFMKQNPQHVLVIVVGEFHSQFGGGLQDRIRARGHQNILTFSQINSDGLSPQELSQEMAPSQQDGPRADFLWVDKAQP
ncbi:MAG: ChaN family lipoprotein [Bdellovibrionia bacterium]